MIKSNSAKLRNASLGLLAFVAMGVQSTGAMDMRVRVPLGELKVKASEWVKSHDALQAGGLHHIATKNVNAIKDQVEAEMKAAIDLWIQGLRPNAGDNIILAANFTAPVAGNAMPSGVNALVNGPADRHRDTFEAYIDAVLAAAKGALPANIGLPLGPVRRRDVARVVENVDHVLADAVHDHILGCYPDAGTHALHATVNTVYRLTQPAILNAIEDNANASIAAALVAANGSGALAGAAGSIAAAVAALKLVPGDAAAAAITPVPHGGGGAVLAGGHGGRGNDVLAAIAQTIREENDAGVTEYPVNNTAGEFAIAAWRVLTK